MEKNGFTMLTSNIAKAKTAFQITIIIFILLFIGLKGIHFEWLKILFGIIKEFHVIYYFTLVVTVFTVWTGILYLFNNRAAIRKFTS